MRREGKLVAALVAAWFGLAGAAQANDAEIVAVEEASDRVLELTIETPAFTEPTKVHVYLPPGYREDRSRDWPVTYFTAGTMNNYNTLFHLGGEELTAEYDSILVSPDGNSGYWSDWYNAGAFGPPMYETYVIDQLIPLIDEEYRTIDKRSGRAILGVSMGGYGAMMLASRHPDLFMAAGTVSGAVDSNIEATAAVLSVSSTFDGAEPDAIYGPRATQEVRWRGHNPTDIADNLRGMDIQVRTANGTPNPGIGEGPDPADLASCVVEMGVHGASLSYHDKLAALEIPHIWRNYGAGCHTPPNFHRQITDTLDRFEKLFVKSPGRPAPFDFRSIEPRFSVWGWKVKADPDRALEFLRMQAAGRRGVVLTGSGLTTIRTAPYFRRARHVKVTVAGKSIQLKPSRSGRIKFGVELGPPHPDQQYTEAARSSGAGGPGYFKTLKVKLKARS
jgi:S-formylglutathione hydrolase FrmB